MTMYFTLSITYFLFFLRLLYSLSNKKENILTLKIKKIENYKI